MDYKELIETLREKDGCHCECLQASNAIETLLEERDAALRTQWIPANLDRSRWEGCEYCKGDLEGYTSCFLDSDGRSRAIYIPEEEAAIVSTGRYNHKYYIPIKYCPFCGRPLTEKAWAELERRINDGQENS